MENFEQSSQLTKAERRHLKKQRQAEERDRQQRREKRKKLLIWLAIIIVAILGLIGLVIMISGRQVLPPTTMAGHIEASPNSHILTEPMDIRVHKHMIEHADGSGPPGVIINYNCQDFDCQPDLLDKLKDIVNEYPSHVYLAPYPNMTVKLVITKSDKQEILEEFDEQRIRDFIEE